MFVCLAIGGGMIGSFYSLGQDTFASAESVWEGAFSLVASVIITIMGAAMLRVSKLQEKWRIKLSQAMETKDSTTGKQTFSFKKWAEKYVMFYLPFITVLREGLEAVIFIGGVSLSFPAKAFPLPVITGLLAGAAVGYIIYRYVCSDAIFFLETSFILTRQSLNSQWWQPSIPPDIPHHFHLLPLPRLRRPLLPRGLVPRAGRLEQGHRR